MLKKFNKVRQETTDTRFESYVNTLPGASLLSFSVASPLQVVLLHLHEAASRVEESKSTFNIHAKKGNTLLIRISKEMGKVMDSDNLTALVHCGVTHEESPSLTHTHFIIRL